MFTRVVEVTCRPGKSKEFSSAFNEKTMPILQNQSGFVDEILLVSNSEPDRVLALSFWKTKDDAEKYQRQQYKNIVESMRPLLQTDPTIRTFEAHTFSGHKNVISQAA
jgi:heme-degrading monooxygenase HmoA